MEKRKKGDSDRKRVVLLLDEIFSWYIRLRDSFVKDGKRRVQCPLCGAIIPIEDAQNMHFIKRGILKYRYDKNNCHAGCMRCNVMLNGNYVIYTRRMQMKYGIEEVDKMIFDKTIYSIRTPELAELVEKHYKLVLSFSYLPETNGFKKLCKDCIKEGEYRAEKTNKRAKNNN